MNKTVLVVLGVVLAALVAIGLTLFGSYVSAVNYGATAEAGIKAAYTNNQNILAQYSQKVQEVAQVPAMYTEDFTKVTRAAIEGRYGADGSKAVFQWLKEQNPQLDSKVYIKVQQVVESGRDQFQTAQTRLIDEKRVYETALNTFWRGLWLRIAGYPKINMDDYKVITTAQTDATFAAGKETAPLKLR
jgi:uncharacterized protein (UPF0333 family)